MNEKSITEKYCVNKNVPGSCCHGKCHLEKTISKSENENDKNPFSTLTMKIKEVEVFFQQLPKTESSDFQTSLKHTCIYAYILQEGIQLLPVKPPAVLG